MNDAEKLQEKSAIEQLRYRYWFSILDKSVDELVNCFAQDVHLEYGFGIELDGHVAVKPFFEMLLGSPDLIRQVPRGANGIIEVKDADSASGRWLVEVVTLKKGEAKGTRIGVQYYEDYRKINGEWKIARMKNDYLYFESMDLKEGP